MSITVETTQPLPSSARPSKASPAKLPAGSSGTVQLVLTRGPGAGAVFPVEPGATTLGRGHDCDIVLEHPTVPDRHATLHRHYPGDRSTLDDIASLNGTYLNRRAIDHATISDGDEIRLGVFRMVFRTTR